MLVFSDVTSVSDDLFGVFTFQGCWDSWMLAKNNTATSGIVQAYFKQINFKYQGLDAAGLEEFLQIVSLIKRQRSEQNRRQTEQHYENWV